MLRAREARYGLLQPIRSEGGFRLYTAQDANRVAGMKPGLDEGLSAAEAARRALAQARPAQGLGLLDDALRWLLSAVRAYDERRCRPSSTKCSRASLSTRSCES